MKEFKTSIVQLYLFLMLAVFPLYYQNKYFDMGDAKYAFFKYVTCCMLLLLAVSHLFEKICSNTKKKFFSFVKPNFSVLDFAVLAYTTVAIFSWLVSPFRAETWIGAPEWYMGMLSQLLFAGIYFAISRFSPSNNLWIWCMGLGAFIAFCIAYLHRFRIDPLGFYEGVSTYHQLMFLGTIGQATWYSSYLCVVLPVFLGIYMAGFQSFSRKHVLARCLCGMLIFVGFGSAITQNSDSIYIGLSAAFLFLLWFAMENHQYWKRFLEILFIASLATKCTGILQTRFPERVPSLDTLSLTITQSKFAWYLLALTVFLYAMTLLIHKNISAEIQKKARFQHLVRIFRKVFYLIILLAILSLPVFIWLVTTGKLPADWSILGKSGYLYFNDQWGNGRGINWKHCIETFREFPIFRKIFGYGPDCMFYYYEAYQHSEFLSFWSGFSVTNAHNEWLTAFFNYGLLGGFSYLLIFIIALFSAVKNHTLNFLVLPCSASILAYMGHNFFCYQQCICTPLIFILLGIFDFHHKKNTGAL